MKTLTASQARVVAFIRSFWAEQGMPPTRQEISEHFGWRSCNAAQCQLQALERKRVIRLLPGTSRGIQFLEGPVCPHCGKPYGLMDLPRSAVY